MVTAPAALGQQVEVRRGYRGACCLGGGGLGYEQEPKQLNTSDMEFGEIPDEVEHKPGRLTKDGHIEEDEHMENPLEGRKTSPPKPRPG